MCSTIDTSRFSSFGSEPDHERSASTLGETVHSSRQLGPDGKRTVFLGFGMVASLGAPILLASDPDDMNAKNRDFI
jgi:hypothetical protein